MCSAVTIAGEAAGRNRVRRKNAECALAASRYTASSAGGAEWRPDGARSAPIPVAAITPARSSSCLDVEQGTRRSSAGRKRPGECYALQREEHHAKNLVGNCVSSWQNNRPPEFTVLCRSVERIWFLLRRGQFHLSRSTQASAVLSTGVSTLRR